MSAKGVMHVRSPSLHFRRRVSTWAIALAISPIFASSLQGGEPDVEFFEKKVRPLLAAKCWDCHGDQKQEGSLRLDSAAAAGKGGKSGPLVGANSSRLIQAVRRRGELKTHPRITLNDPQWAVLDNWVLSGAVWPPVQAAVKPTRNKDDRPLFAASERSFWAFQPITDPQPPKVVADQAITPLDQFVLAKLHAEGLVPARQADRRTLLRRVTFDLIGLPPTPKEIDAFLADEAPTEKAFAKVVERLLDSVYYGERWGRRWLDVVRYADTTGAGGQVVFRFSHRYRDYVIRALNEDKPYDQFVVEQLAGDLLPPTSDIDQAVQRVIATGFLMLGQKEISEPDKVKTVLDIVDEQIDVTSRVFLGLTVACARCHDHKFDPIPTLDYYSLAGIFKSTATMPDLSIVSMWQEYPLLNVPGQNEPLIVMAAKDGEPADMRVLIRGDHHNPGEEAPRRYLQIIAGENHPPIETEQSGRLELARWIASAENPLTARVMVNRIWQGHFGKGLVETGDNFGKQGARPTHPELLDWLASRFIESGWSVKAMHRLMLNSSTYQMRSDYFDARAHQLDPENQWLWRARRRRLEAEELRDATLAVAGRLDRKVGGSLFDYGHRYLDSVIDAKRGLYGLNLGGRTYQPYFSLRRSVYLPVIRERLAEILERFDAADPNAVTTMRNETIVSPQALFLMNGSFIREQSFHLARQLLSQVRASDEDRLRLVYQQLFARIPKQEELNDAVAYLGEYSQRLRSLGRSEGAGYTGGTKIVVTLHRAHHSASLFLGAEKILNDPDGVRIRLAVTSVDRQRASRNLSTDWTWLEPARATSARNAPLTIQSDGTVFVAGGNVAPDTYTIVANTELTDMTSLRLEVLPDPNGTPERTSSDLFVLAEFQATVAPLDGDATPRQLVVQNATAKLLDADVTISPVIDGDLKTKWPIGPERDRPQPVIFEFEDGRLAPWQSLCRALLCSNEYMYLK